MTKGTSSNSGAFEAAVNFLLELRMKAKANKDWVTADKIRDELCTLGFVIKDTKEGFSWELKE